MKEIHLHCSAVLHKGGGAPALLYYALFFFVFFPLQCHLLVVMAEVKPGAVVLMIHYWLRLPFVRQLAA